MTPPVPSRTSPARSDSSLDFAPVVLLVDNERVIRELCRESLAEEPLRVLAAGDGQEALALAEAWVPDVVVTDVEMPRLDGFGLVRALRRLYPDVPVIVMTGAEEYAGRPIEQVAAEHGVVATFTKPFDLDRLHAAVRSAVSVLASPGRQPADGDRAA
jgi:two-component system chemotaxis response regulator CheY